jgi:hypothetical protein
MERIVVEKNNRVNLDAIIYDLQRIEDNKNELRKEVNELNVDYLFSRDADETSVYLENMKKIEDQIKILIKERQKLIDAIVVLSRYQL